MKKFLIISLILSCTSVDHVGISSKRNNPSCEETSKHNEIWKCCGNEKCNGICSTNNECQPVCDSNLVYCKIIGCVSKETCEKFAPTGNTTIDGIKTECNGSPCDGWCDYETSPPLCKCYHAKHQCAEKCCGHLKACLPMCVQAPP